jgi:hypothetical protein
MFTAVFIAVYITTTILVSAILFVVNFHSEELRVKGAKVN